MINQETKVCIGCKQSKSLDSFGKNKKQADGLHYYCKDCIKLKTDKRKDKNKEYHKKYYEENKDKVKVYMKEYRKANREKINEYQRNLPIETKRKFNCSEKKKLREKERRQDEVYKQRRSEYFKEKYQKEIQFKLKKQFESKLNQLLHKNDISNESIELIGCTIPEYKAYLEAMFAPTMTWENYGIEWQIDRITPFCEWNLGHPEEQKLCYHYTNSQPLFTTTRVIDGEIFVGNLNKNKF